ncbi:MAG: lipoyl(octanoyl) transferase, partial [Chloroflexia bacterium]
MIDLGLIDYAECWALQNKFAAEVEGGHALETLLLLEHPHTYTFGRSGGRDHVLISEDDLKERGISTYDVDRGGDITYHGPGQVVAYPVINLRNYGERLNYGGYVRTLERALIATLAELGISSHPL